MNNRQGTEKQTMIHNTLHRELKMEQLFNAIANFEIVMGYAFVSLCEIWPYAY